MLSVGAYEAKTHLPRLLERVMKGESIVITKHGVPVAVLGPHDPQSSVDTRSLIKDIRDFRKGRTLDGTSLRELMEEGRR
jgi:prevent-host-death family protein